MAMLMPPMMTLMVRLISEPVTMGSAPLVRKRLPRDELAHKGAISHGQQHDENETSQVKGISRPSAVQSVHTAQLANAATQQSNASHQ